MSLSEGAERDLLQERSLHNTARKRNEETGSDKMRDKRETKELEEDQKWIYVDRAGKRENEM